MKTPNRSTRVMALSAGLAMAAALLAPAARTQVDPATLPARDSHEGLLVAADPFTDVQRSKDRFGKKTPLDGGILAVEVYFRNDNDKPILINLETIRLTLNPPGGPRQQLEPMSVDEVLQYAFHKQRRDVNKPRVPLPTPIPKSSGSKDEKKLEENLRPALLEMSLLPPKTTVHGFLYFNLGGKMEKAQYASIYLPDLEYMHNKKPLFYFEVDLGKAVQ